MRADPGQVVRSGWGHAFLDRSLVKFRIHPVSSSSSRRFFESRVAFAAKLASLFPDDSRMRRYYHRDLIAPRFFQTSLDDYVRACAQRDWDQERCALGVLNHFAGLRHAGLWLHCKMLCIQEPRLFRMLVMVNDHLPDRARFVHNPGQASLSRRRRAGRDPWRGRAAAPGAPEASPPLDKAAIMR